MRTKILSLLCALSFCAGCVSTHSTKLPVPIIPPTKLAPGETIETQATPEQKLELQLLRAAVASSPVNSVPAAAPAPVTPEVTPPVAPEVAPKAVTLPDPVVSVPITSTTNTAKPVKSHKLTFYLVGLAVLLGAGIGIGGHSSSFKTLVKKVLTWVKSHDTAASLKTLATEAKTKVEADVKSREGYHFCAVVGCKTQISSNGPSLCPTHEALVKSGSHPASQI